MKKRSTLRFLAMLLLLAQLFSLTAGITVFAEDQNETERDNTPVRLPAPYARRNCSPLQSISMGGSNYDQGLDFEMGYTGYSNGESANASINLDGKFSTVSFDAGYISGHERSATLTVYGDDKVLLEGATLAHTDIARSFTLNVEGVRRLKFTYTSGAYDKTHYGVGNLLGEQIAELDTNVYTSDEFYDVPRYKLSGDLITGEFEMGGRKYENGYGFRMGYVLGGSKSVSFNFKKQYEEMTFDVAKYLGDSADFYAHSITMNIEVDGAVVPEYENVKLVWDNLVFPVKLDLKGVSQVTIKFNNGAYDTAACRIGNIQLKSDGKAHGILLDAKAVEGTDDYTATLTDKAPEIALNPRVYPSDGPQEYVMTVTGEEYISVTEEGVVTALHKGDAVINFAVPNTDISVDCVISSKLTTHIWDEGVVTKEPTLKEKGEKVYTCTICEETKKEALPKLTECEEHTWDDGEITKEPTYTEDGEKKLTCTVCGKIETAVLEKLVCTEHAWDKGEVTKKPTYEAEGEKLYTCTNCGETKTEPVEKLVCTEHAWDKGEVTKEPTYEAEGEKLYTCTNCGETKTEPVEKLVCTEHAWDKGEVTKKPTYEAEGEKLYTCTNCGETKTEPVEKLVCTKHAWDKGEVTKEPTYEAEGEKLYTCTNCGETKTEPVEKLVCTKHAWDKGEVTKEPTYEAEGEKLYTCTNCGETKTEPVEKLVCTKHKWDEGKIIKEPTFIESGERLFTCTVCGSTLTEVLPQIELENPFEDVTDNDWFYNPVLWAYSNGITGGIAANLFGPHESCTRGQVVTFLWAAAGKPEPTSDYNPFVDVVETDYFYKAVLWAVENGITKGVAEDMFGPAQACTRGQIVTFLWAAHNRPEPTLSENPFIDFDSSAYYYQPVLWAVENEITTGIGEGMFGPENICTRCQIVTFLYKASMIEEQPEVPEVPETPEQPQTALVTDAYSKTIEGEYYTHCYHIPQINLPDDLAAGWNEAMYDTLYATIENRVFKEMEKYDRPSLAKMVYVWGQKDNLVSIVLREDEYEYDWSTHTFYTVSTETGKQVVNDDIYAAYGMTEEDFYAAVKIVLAAVMAEEAEHYKNMISAEEIQELIDKTLDDVNIKGSVPFISPDGKLSFMGGVYTPAGAGRYYHMWTLEGENITVKCAEHQK